MATCDRTIGKSRPSLALRLDKEEISSIGQVTGELGQQYGQLGRVVLVVGSQTSRETILSYCMTHRGSRSLNSLGEIGVAGTDHPFGIEVGPQPRLRVLRHPCLSSECDAGDLGASTKIEQVGFRNPPERELDWTPTIRRLGETLEGPARIKV